MVNAMNSRKSLVVVVILLAGTIGPVLADFTCGDPSHLGATVNSSSLDAHPSISADGLSVFFYSTRSGGQGGRDIWMATRKTVDDQWTAAVNLGPTVNSSYRDSGPSISADGLALFFGSNRPGGSGGSDVWMTTRATTSAPWSEPVNLGPTVNSSSSEAYMNISADGLELYFQSDRPGGLGGYDIWVTTRMTMEDPWGAPVNLGPTINSSSGEGTASISPDGLALFFASDRPGGYAVWDIVVATRTTTASPWGEPVNLGPVVNGTAAASGPAGPADGYTFYFPSDRAGGKGSIDLWQVSLEPAVDFNGDYRVDMEDLVILIEYWGQDEPSLDMGPMPWGDGMIDAEDLEVLMSHWGQDANFIAHWKLDETGGDVAYDSVADNDAVVMGEALWQREGGYVDGALQFDGVTSYLNASFIIDPPRQPFSAYAWIKGGQPGQTVISQQNAFSEWLSLDAAGALTCTLTFPLPAVTSDVVLTDGLWHHIGLVSDGSGISLYVDHIEVARSDTSPLMPAIGDLHVGAGKHLEPGTFWSGLIDDVRIYNRVVTP